MSRLFRQATVLAVFGLAALVSACGDDDDVTVFDAPVGSADARVADAAPTTADAAPPTVYNITLTKAAEVPLCSAAGANATGTATITVSADNSTITAHVEYSGLSGTATAGHIHAGAVGVMGGVVLPFTSPAPSPINQIFHASDYQAASGAPATFAAFVTSLRAGGAYVNLHVMSTCAPGEIRGQIQ